MGVVILQTPSRQWLNYWTIGHWSIEFSGSLLYLQDSLVIWCFTDCVFLSVWMYNIWYDDIHDFTNTKLMRRRNASWTRLETWRIMLVQPKRYRWIRFPVPGLMFVLIVWNHGSDINNMCFTRFPDAKFHHWPRNYKRVAQQLARGPAFSKVLLFSCITRGHDDPIVGNAIGWVDSNI